MNDFWNKRYCTKEFAYGESPNQFLVEELKKLKPEKILFPAEGEGRNAVYAATLGWEVTAFDPSREGKKKAELLAAKHNSKIDYQIAGYQDVTFPPDYFDCLVLIFAHMPPDKRNEYHQKLLGFLKPGGRLLVEGFAKEQIEKNTGGPQHVDMLFSKEELQTDFSNLSEITILEKETSLDEGPFHQGIASVIRITGKK
ncbi:methyltransferase domain-containing protein [Prolixibacteraceae bacterium Z1-6]|uniref:Methyltransferase domain-containing protein n=1 Tax=Draconibacterium aestuarii TaxID=2998507 RepID=A0A9X3F2A3_9BACT|nr:methyltransferase domain-containing protein [Prolixibacteraceae bacterium Z1-6]